MKQNISEILQRQLLLMGYRLDSTLSENIKNLPIIKEQTAPGTKLDTSYGLSPEEEEKRKKENEAQTYPNYCPFKEYTVLPGEVEIRGEKGTSKVVGVDAIPKGFSGETYCAYRGAGNTLLYLPTFVEDITFINGTFDEYDRLLKYAMKPNFEFKTGKLGLGLDNKVENVNKNPDPVTEQTKNAFIKYATETYPKGTVLNFTINRNKFSSMRQRVNPTEGSTEGDSEKISTGSFQGMGVGQGVSDLGGTMNSELYYKFVGYYSWDLKKYYEPPKLVELREDWQIFVDEWGIWIAIGASVTAAIVGSFFGATEAVLLEILVEGIIGGVMAYRDFQKGNNIGVAFNIFFALCPWLKLTKYFRGIDNEVFKSLGKKLGDSGLSSSSSIGDYVAWYQSGKLTDDEQKLFTMFMEYDDITKQQMIKEFSEQLKNKGVDEMVAFMEAEGIIEGGLKEMAKAHPELLKDIKFLQKLWAKEVTLQLGAGVGLGFMADLCCSEILNDNEKAKLTELSSIIPDSLKEMVAINIAMNREKSPEIVNELYEGLETKIIPEAVKNSSDYWKKATQDTLSNLGIKPNVIDSTRLYDEPSWVLSDSLEQLDDKKIEKLRKTGWVTFPEYLKKYSGVHPLEPGRLIQSKSGDNTWVTHHWLKVK
jgi:hypothetical protein